MDIFKLDYRISQKDLNYTFYGDATPPYNSRSVVQPYWVRYEIVHVFEDRDVRVGPSLRVPSLRGPGVYRPNFIIGREWRVGLYKIVWKYKISADSRLETADVLFRVVTDGLYNNMQRKATGHIDVAGKLGIR